MRAWCSGVSGTPGCRWTISDHGFAGGRSFHCGRTPTHPFVNPSVGNDGRPRQGVSTRSISVRSSREARVGSIRHSLEWLQSRGHLSLTRAAGARPGTGRAGAGTSSTFLTMLVVYAPGTEKREGGGGNRGEGTGASGPSPRGSIRESHRGNAVGSAKLIRLPLTQHMPENGG